MADKKSKSIAPVEVSNVLDIDSVSVGDRPAIYTLGLVGAESLKKTKMAVFMVDVLGRIQLMPPAAVKVLIKPRISDSELDGFDELEAIQAMLAQEDSEELIAQYLHQRSLRKAKSDGNSL